LCLNFITKLPYETSLMLKFSRSTVIIVCIQIIIVSLYKMLFIVWLLYQWVFLPTIYGKNKFVIIITGAVYISQLLNITHTLQVLYMSDNDIGDDGMAVISETLQHNKSLTKLMVWQCGLSVKGTVVCKM